MKKTARIIVATAMVLAMVLAMVSMVGISFAEDGTTLPSGSTVQEDTTITLQGGDQTTTIEGDEITLNGGDQTIGNVTSESHSTATSSSGASSSTSHSGDSKSELKIEESFITTFEKGAVEGGSVGDVSPEQKQRQEIKDSGNSEIKDSGNSEIKDSGNSEIKDSGNSKNDNSNKGVSLSVQQNYEATKPVLNYTAQSAAHLIKADGTVFIEAKGGSGMLNKNYEIDGTVNFTEESLKKLEKVKKGRSAFVTLVTSEASDEYDAMAGARTVINEKGNLDIVESAVVCATKHNTSTSVATQGGANAQFSGIIAVGAGGSKTNATGNEEPDGICRVKLTLYNNGGKMTIAPDVRKKALEDAEKALKESK